MFKALSKIFGYCLHIAWVKGGSNLNVVRHFFFFFLTAYELISPQVLLKQTPSEQTAGGMDYSFCTDMSGQSSLKTK